MAEAEHGGRVIKSVEQACEILKAIQLRDGLTLTETADIIGLSLGTTHTYLHTLQKHRFVAKDGQTFELHPRMLTLGEHIRNQLDIYRAAKEEVDNLAYETGECVHLFTERDGELLIVTETFGPRAVGKDLYMWNRERTHPIIHSTAAGKAILAERSSEGVDRLLEDFELRQLTQSTITDIDALHEELKRVREKGYAVNDQEQRNSMRALSAAILGPDRSVQGALSVSGPMTRMNGDRFHEELPERVMEVANSIEVKLQSPEFSHIES